MQKIKELFWLNVEFIAFGLVVAFIVTIDLIGVGGAELINQWVRGITNLSTAIAVLGAANFLYQRGLYRGKPGLYFYRLLLVDGLGALILLLLTIYTSLIASPPFWVWSIENYLRAAVVIRLSWYLVFGNGGSGR